MQVADAALDNMVASPDAVSAFGSPVAGKRFLLLGSWAKSKRCSMCGGDRRTGRTLPAKGSALLAAVPLTYDIAHHSRALALVKAAPEVRE